MQKNAIYFNSELMDFEESGNQQFRGSAKAMTASALQKNYRSDLQVLEGNGKFSIISR